MTDDVSQEPEPVEIDWGSALAGETVRVALDVVDGCNSDVGTAFGSGIDQALDWLVQPVEGEDLDVAKHRKVTYLIATLAELAFASATVGDLRSNLPKGSTLSDVRAIWGQKYPQLRV